MGLELGIQAQGLKGRFYFQVRGQDSGCWLRVGCVDTKEVMHVCKSKGSIRTSTISGGMVQVGISAGCKLEGEAMPPPLGGQNNVDSWTIAKQQNPRPCDQPHPLNTPLCSRTSRPRQQLQTGTSPPNAPLFEKHTPPETPLHKPTLDPALQTNKPPPKAFPFQAPYYERTSDPGRSSRHATA